jgi:hypothetical protein
MSSTALAAASSASHTSALRFAAFQPRLESWPLSLLLLQAIQNVASVLKSGTGRVLFRDYAAGAQANPPFHGVCSDQPVPAFAVNSCPA